MAVETLPNILAFSSPRKDVVLGDGPLSWSVKDGEHPDQDTRRRQCSSDEPAEGTLTDLAGLADDLRPDCSARQDQKDSRSTFTATTDTAGRR